ncbi:MAG: response regulator [Deltaproteobacteria bacterium]|nr:response regulator [Deltaproteobacteria bacterium]
MSRRRGGGALGRRAGARGGKGAFVSNCATQRVLGILPGDLGRPLKDIAWRFRDDGTFDRMNAAQHRLPPLPREPARHPLNVRTDPELAATELGAAFRAAYRGAVVELPGRHSARRHLDTALEAVDRAADLTRQMLAYSGRGTFAVRPVDLNAVIVENLPLLRAALSKRVRLRRRLAGALPAIDADVGQLRQVVVNLVGNAAEATGERGGTVGIVTHEVAIGPREREYVSPAGEPLAPGRYVVLEVTDRGQGMDATTRARIFEPFFSTKAAGRGLGLAAVLGIVRAHKGAIAVDSAPGKGTRFRVALPAGAAGARPAPVEKRRAEVPATAAAAIGTVLVIDDEPLVRQVSVGILAHGGFRALQAGGGAEGVEIFRQHVKEVVAVVLDLSMPGKTPGETLAALRAIDPRVPVLLTSGYAAPSVDPNLRGVAAFIPKPSTPEEYVAILRGALAAKRRRAGRRRSAGR